MSDALAKQLEELRKLKENGTLSEDTYRNTVAALKASAGNQAGLAGAGALAQGNHNIVAGQAGLAVGGHIYGNVYLGTPTENPTEALAIYRRILVGGCRQLPLKGLDKSASDPSGGRKQIDLERVFVSLDTTTQVEIKKGKKKKTMPWDREKSRPLGLLEAVVQNQSLVILGGPGSGKTTFVNHLCLCLALHGLEPQAGWCDRLPGWPKKEVDLVPLKVVLRDFARATVQVIDKAEPCHLWDFIKAWLVKKNLAFVAAPLHQALEDGKAIVLLDGLDEIPSQDDRRVFVRDAVSKFIGRYPKCRVLVTCRTFSYEKKDGQLNNIPTVTVAPFDPEKIHRFIDAWYAELKRLGTPGIEDSEAMAGRLKEALNRPDLARLAPNPLLLTVIALVHTHKNRLPDARALLYEETVEILLWRWEEHKADGDRELPTLRQLLEQVNRQDIDLRGVLMRLAFEAHRDGGAEGGDQLADIGEARLQRELAMLHPSGNRQWAQDVVEALKLRAGLLIERDIGVYTFPHRTFQEYLAGVHLGAQSDFVAQAVTLAAKGAFWREVILLAVGRMVFLGTGTANPLLLVGELCPEGSVTTEIGWRQAWLAGDVLLEMGVNRATDTDTGRIFLKRVRQRLVDLLQGGALSAKERVAAGNTLARLGDSRFREDFYYLPAEPLLGFVEIPAGSFLMGSKKDDAKADNDERPQHTVELPRYYLAKYPVTVAQFKAFVEASGHKPTDKDCLSGVANHPVGNVTWHDALAYCEWLTAVLRKQNDIPELIKNLLRHGENGGKPWRITLPSEAEWEKAARGVDGLEYPWGNEADAGKANYDATGIGMTSAVGCFPGGVSPYGCLDMAGNVWEWTKSLWGKEWQTPQFGYPYHSEDGRENLQAADEMLRVLRGGSFNKNVQDVRCAARDWDFPYYGWAGFRLIGFRVVFSPEK